MSTISVSNAQSASTGNQYVVENGGVLTVASAVTVSNTQIQSGGVVSVLSGGVDSQATISAGGGEMLSGSASGDQIYGTQTLSGGAASTAVANSETVFAGGQLDLYLKGAVASGTIVSSGGMININGSAYASNTILSGGGLIDLESTQAYLTGAVTFAGGGNEIELVKMLSGNAANSATLSGFGATDSIVVSSAGATPTTSIYAGSGALAGDEIAKVTSGAVTDTFVFANAGGSYSAQTLSWTLSGTTETLKYTPGATNVVTSITTSTASGAYTETSGNTLLVLSGGSVSAATILSGGSLTVSGGSDVGAKVSAGGSESVLTGTASGDTIYGTLSASGAAAALSNETVYGGGLIDLVAGATASGVTLEGAATLELATSNAAVSGALNFAGGGNTLLISALASAGAGELAVISGFSTTDKVDIAPIGAASAQLAFATSGGNEVVTVSGAGGVSESFVFSGTGTYNSATMAVTSDVNGDAVLELTSNITIVSSATASGAYTVSSGGFLEVVSGGSVSAATVQSGGELLISGGVDSGSIVQSGGVEIVDLASGSASGDRVSGSLVVNGGQESGATVVAGGGETVYSGSALGDVISGGLTVGAATISNETVASGGSATLGAGAVDSGMTLQSGGTLNVSANTGSATLSGDSIYGTVNTVSGHSATFTNETVYSGGVLNLQNSNEGVNITVSSGGTLTLSGKEYALDTALAGGATVILESPKALLSGSTTPALTFENGHNTLSITNLGSSGSGGVSGTISGFGQNDQVVVSGGFVAGSTFTFSADASGNEVATVSNSSSGETDILTFSGAQPSGYTLSWTAAGGDEVLQYAAVTTATVSTATASGAYTLFGGNTVDVVAGGSVSAVTVGFGGDLIVDGGDDFVATVLSGGAEYVSAGVASGDQISGSAVVAGGAMSGATVFSGGVLDVTGGVANTTVVKGGGVLDIGAGSAAGVTLLGGATMSFTDPNATVSGGFTFANGGNELVVTALSSAGAGDQAVISGFSSSDAIDLTGISPTGASISYNANGDGTETVTVSGTAGSESFIFNNQTTYGPGTMALVPDSGSGVELALKSTPSISINSVGGFTNQASTIVNGYVNVTADPWAVGQTVTVYDNGNLAQGWTATVGANGFWSADVTFANDSGANALTATVTDKAGQSGSTGSATTYNVNTSAAAFTAGNLVLSIYGDGSGTGNYTLDQAAPITLEQITTTGSVVGQIELPVSTSTNGATTEYGVSGEYGSASEGLLQLSADGHSLTIMGYGVNYQSFDTNSSAYDPAGALGQTTSLNGVAGMTTVPRVAVDINGNGVIDSSTAVTGVFNENNPRSVATVDGSGFWLAGQGVKGDTTQGVFYAADGATTATAINTATDTRIAEIYNGVLYVSADSTQGATNISEYGGLPTSATAPIVLNAIDNSVTLTAATENTVNAGSVGQSVNLSPESFFFANADTLYVADSGLPKNGGVGDGGLQKWVLNTSTNTWNLEYTISQGLNLVDSTSATTGVSGLIGLTGEVVGGNVVFYATTEGVAELDKSYLVTVTDSLASTTLSSSGDDQFTTLMTAGDDQIIRGVSFAPTAPCFCTGVRILTARGEVAVEDLAVGDEVVTASGATRPIVWIGRRELDLCKHRDPKSVWPVRVARDAFGEGLPRRDLWLSPGHNIAFEGRLIPASALVNGQSVAQVRRDAVEYWHIELDAHDVLYSDGLPSESYLDCGNREAFENGGVFIEAHPDFQPKHWRETCLPLAQDGPAVAAARARLLARLAERGLEIGEDADVHAIVDGRRVEPIWLGERKLAFALPGGARSVRLQSATFVPSETCVDNVDDRRLGLCVVGLQIDGEAVALDDARLEAADWHDCERRGEVITRRWTRGAAALPASARIVVVTLGGRGYYWAETASNVVRLKR